MPPSPSPSLLAFFTDALKTFTTSSIPFSVLRTVPATPAATPPKHLIILDSSFNPPTAAHLGMALAALHQHSSSMDYSVAKVLLLLAVENADKKPKPASFPHRLCMMEALASHIHTAFHVNVDIGVTTKPYFHDKSAVAASSGIYPSDTEQIFLAGYDTLIRILNPKYYPEGMKTALDPFFDRARLRVVLRAGGDWGNVEEQKTWVRGLRDGEEDWGGESSWVKDRIDLVDGFDDGLSSSQVREAVASGKGGWEKMVPKEVERYIREERLYTGETGQ